MIKVNVVTDSKNEFGNRITTMVVTFPRIILAEFNTHRMFSRNSASSRAIPFKKLIKSVRENPFIPIAWQKDHKGMQGIEYFNFEEAKILTNKWLKARDRAIESALDLAAGVFNPNEVFTYDENGDLITPENHIGTTKQLVNRLIEPFMYHTVIVTATEWENFFALRCPQYVFRGKGKSGEYNYTVRSKKDWIANFEKEHPTQSIPDCNWLTLNKGQAEIHMMALAEAMWDAYNESTPRELKADEWHIPFGDKIDPTLVHRLELGENESDESIACKIAIARCARISYTVVGEEGKPDNYENDIKLHDRLATSGHWSPFEHCAKVMSKEEYQYYRDTSMLNENDKGTHKGKSWGWSGNFRGFIQYRKMFNNENITK